MKRNLVIPLILKDWHLQRGTLTILLVGGLVSIGLLLTGGMIVRVVGLFFTFLFTILLGILLPQTTVVSERKQQNETFVMSLPVTPLEYAAAKILANLSMFLVVWLALVFGLMFAFHALGAPGFVPAATVGVVAIFVGFLTNLCVAIVVRSEKLWLLTQMTTNVCYGLVWVAVYRIPNISRQASGPVAVWSKDILLLLGIEFLVLVVVLALGAYGQSRRKSFL